MKQEFTLKGLDCPNCAAKIEKGVRGLSDIVCAKVNLVNQSLTIESEMESAALLEKIAEVVHRYEPEVEVAERASSGRFKGKFRGEDDREESRPLAMRLVGGAVIYGIGVALTLSGVTAGLPFLVAAYFILGGDVLWHAFRNLFRGRLFDEHFLMTVSTVCAFVIGESLEAVAVMLLYQIGEFLQSFAVGRSIKSISALMDMRPDVAAVLRGGELKALPPEDVAIGETIVVKPGERIPLDGIVVEGTSMLDTRALTGESVPRSIRRGDTALSGCINQSGVLKIETTKTFGESTASKIIELVENASASKARTENFITTFARHYTPAVVVLAAALALLPPLTGVGGWAEWLHRGCVFLVISCPCALVISIPLTFMGGLGAASRRGVLVKGGNCLEALTKVGVVVFDKTGTLTRGVFKVVDIIPADGFSREQVLSLAAKAERFSNHPIAKSILCASAGEVESSDASGYEEIEGRGVRIQSGGMTVLVGSARLMEEAGVAFQACGHAGTIVYVAAGGRFAGCIVIADELKSDSGRTIKALRQYGVGRTVMLTGDEEEIAKAVAAELEMDESHARLLPAQKVEAIDSIMAKTRKGKKLVFIGDGINDAPVIARADIGIAMGAFGADAAIDAADVVLMTDEPSKLLEAMDVAAATRRIAMQNIVFALGVKMVLMLLGATGVVGMWEAVFGDVGVTVLAVFNSMRLLHRTKRDSL